jgi:hypothetical protein
MATTVSNASTSFDVGLAALGMVGNIFRICWRHSQDVSFTVEVGTFEMVGPRPTVKSTCTKGYPCNVTLVGHGLSADNGLLLVSGKSCLNASFKNSSVPIATGLVGGPAQPMKEFESTYILGTALVGEPHVEHFLCWGFN